MLDKMKDAVELEDGKVTMGGIMGATMTKIPKRRIDPITGVPIFEENEQKEDSKYENLRISKTKKFDREGNMRPLRR